MKIQEHIYQEMQIHFLVNPGDKNVMVNATEMAKIFDKRVERFLKASHTKAYILVLKRPPNGGSLRDDEVIKYRGRNGVYFHRRLAFKFAAWLDPVFEDWVLKTVEDVMMGNYSKHWEAHASQEEAKIMMETLKSELLTAGTPEIARQYFQYQRQYKDAKNAKTRAIRNQLSLFDN